MTKSYYLFKSANLQRQQNTIKITFLKEETEEPDNEQKPKFLPVEQIEEIFALGNMRFNSAFLNFLGKQGISLHMFDYYENYTGSFTPKKQLISGKVQVEQVMASQQLERRMTLARAFIDGGSFNLRRNLLYYKRREVDLDNQIEKIDNLREQISNSNNIAELMGIEGNIRQVYYSSFNSILNIESFSRKKKPSTDWVNALISFGNALLYAKILTQIYHTQLLPAVSFLHEPGERRFSLSLDISEVFKPLLVDRLIFRLINKKEITEKDFDQVDEAFYLKEKGKKTFLAAWEENLNKTIKHRTLKKNVRYLRLIRLEAYKIIKDILQIEPYIPFKIWW